MGFQESPQEKLVIPGFPVRALELEEYNRLLKRPLDLEPEGLTVLQEVGGWLRGILLARWNPYFALESP